MSPAKLVATALLLLALPAAADPVVLGRAQLRPPVLLTHDGSRRALQAGDGLQAGDRLATGAGGRAAFVLAGGGYLSLGANSVLRVHSVDAGAGAKTIVRLVLETGVLRLDPKNGEDLRLNAGALRLRVYGADIWAGAEAAGDTVCLLRGAVEFQDARGGSGRIDNPGECVFISDSRAPLRYTPAPTILANKLGQTDLGSATAPASLPPAPRPSGPQLRTPPDAATEPTGWTVVILSLADEESAILETQGWREQGFDAHTFVDTIDGRRVHRVGLGRFETREEARAFAANVKTRLNIEQAWVASY